MSRTSVWQIAITLILLSAGFIVVGTVGYLMSPDWLSANEIRIRAEKAVKQPEYPVPPSGKQIIETRNRQECIALPQLQGLGIRMKEICRDVAEQIPRFVDATTEEMRQWEEQVALMRQAYQDAVTSETNRISDQQRADLKSYVKDMVQIATGIFGMVSGLVALWISATRSGDDKPKNNRSWRFRRT